MEELVKLFRKSKSRFYWFDFTMRGQRYRGSTGETKAVRATKVASIRLAQALEHGDLFPTRSPVLAELCERFLNSLEDARLEEKTKKFYRNGGRLLKTTAIFSMRLAEITTHPHRDKTRQTANVERNVAGGPRMHPSIVVARLTLSKWCP